MIFSSILLKLLFFLLIGTSRVAALAALLAAVALDVAVWRRRDRARGATPVATWGTVLGVNVACVVAGIFLNDMAETILIRFKEGIPFAAWAIGLLLQAVRLPVSSVGGSLHLSTMSGALELPMTYSGLGLPAILLLLGFGAIYLLCLKASRREGLAGFRIYAAAVLAASFLRLACMTGLFLFACYFFDYKTGDLPVLPFADPRFVGLTLLPFLLLFAPLLRAQGVFSGGDAKPLPSGERRAKERAIAASRFAGRRRAWACIAGMAVLLGIFFWKPEGTPKNGTVVISTFHTHWSPTTRAYDKQWFGSASGYNYYCVKTLLNVFFDVRELSTRITEDSLAGASVLLIYDPDVAFTPEERKAVRNFVRRGGGLFLIGDHTNVFGSASHLNSLCEPFGFTYRDDVLFDQRADFFQIVFPGKTSSFLLKGIDLFKFRGPCSLRPVSPLAWTVIDIPNSKSLRAIYCVNNFYPRPADNPAMKTGRFAVAVAANYGRGRVLAFGDSTIFSEFEIFYPGKYEILTNVARWLDHRDAPLWVLCRRAAALAAVLLFVWGLAGARTRKGALAWCVAAILLFYLASHSANLLKKRSTVPPDARRPAQFLFFAAEENDTRWALRQFVNEGEYSERYDIFVQWVLRNGMFPAFYVTGERPHHLYEHLRRSPGVQTGLAFVLRTQAQMTLLERVAPGALTELQRYLFLVGPGITPEALAESLAAKGCFAAGALAQAPAVAGVSNTRVVRQDGRTYVFVFDAPRFSDKMMGFSEKVMPSAAQKDLYEQEYKILDTVFSHD